MSPYILGYGNNQNPICPSPDAFIRLINPSNPSKFAGTKAIVDSGAVMTCIPESIFSKLGKLQYSNANVRDVNNIVISRKTYIVNIQLENKFFSNIEVIVISKDYALIGRDILNQKKVTLNAPESIWIYDCNGDCPLHITEIK